MQLFRCCAAAVLATALLRAIAVAGQAPATPQAPPQPRAGTAEFTLFLGGSRVGAEQVRVARSGTTWIISSTALFGPPLNLTINRFEVTYTADWQPVDLQLEATQRAQTTRTLALATSFGVTTAINEITQNGVTNSKTDQVSARTIVLPNSFYAAYEGLAARLASAQPGTELPAYIAPETEIRIAVKSVVAERWATPAGPLPIRQYAVVFQNPDGPLHATVTIDAGSRLVRLEIPAAGLSLVRSDLATISTRSQPIRNPTDSDVIIPAPGFSLAGTLTMPPGMGRLRHPAIVLAGGSGQVERDEVVAGVPIFAHLAGALANEGFLVLRYDRRGIGQSGGRSERVTLQDYADDLVGAVKWLSKRSDVDPRRIAVAGYSEGGAVAMLAAAREKKIASLVLTAAPGGTGADLVLEQQRHLLDTIKATDADRQAKIELQQRIQTAVVTDKGWDAIPAEVRGQAESPWFRSLLLFDAAKVMPKIKQPVLIVHGAVDRHVPPHHADKLAQLARTRKNAPPIDLVHLPGLNHLLVPATTGEVAEYGALTDKTVAPAVSKAIADWLKK